MNNFIQPALTIGAAVASGGTSLWLNAAAALSVVGAVTDNKTLKILGAAAGIYGAATGEGIFGAEKTIDGYTEAERAAESAAISGETGLAERVAENTTTNAVTGTVAPTDTVSRGINPSAGEKAVSGNIAKAAGTPTVPPPAVPPGSVPPGGGGIFGGFNLKDPQTLYGTGLIAQGVGPAVAGAFGPDQEKIAADKLALDQARLDAEQAARDQRNANFNSRGLILGVRPRAGAVLYPPYPYRSPAAR